MKKNSLDLKAVVDYYLVQNNSRKATAFHFQISEATLRRFLRDNNIIKPSTQVSNLRKSTNLKRYGQPTPFQNVDIQKKTQETVKERYGVDNVSQLKTIQRKKEETSLQKFGVKYYTQTAEYSQKIKDRKSFPSQSHWDDNTIETLKTKQALEGFLQNNKVLEHGYTSQEICEKLGCSVTTLNRRIREFGLEKYINREKSNYEVEIQNLLRQWDIEVFSTRGIIPPYEIDLYSPKYNIGIEFNGNYWHSEEVIDKLYHQRKSLLAEQKGVFVYHIFEYEWNVPKIKQKIISQLRNLFKQNSCKIYGRNTYAQLITKAQIKKEFLDKNHRQGNDKSTIWLGLFHQEELVSIMTFCKPRFNKNYNWELSRFCSLENCNVLGGAQKLFSFFLCNFCKKGESIISYSDIGKTRGSVYKTLGFSQKGISTPNYVWCSGKEDFFSRYQCQMKGERIIMKEKGYFRIYDAGNKIWIYSKI